MNSAVCSAFGVILTTRRTCRQGDDGPLEAGNRVVCVTATHGEAGFPDNDPRSLAERAAVRELELDACLDVLGVTEHEWMPYPDGACDRIPDASRSSGSAS